MPLRFKEPLCYAILNTGQIFCDALQYGNFATGKRLWQILKALEKSRRQAFAVIGRAPVGTLFASCRGCKKFKLKLLYLISP